MQCFDQECMYKNAIFAKQDKGYRQIKKLCTKKGKEKRYIAMKEHK